MKRARRLLTFDCETDPFLHGRVPVPFIWGAYDGENYFIERDTDKFIEWLAGENCFAYAHNGGKFDMLYFLRRAGASKIKIIGNRIAELRLGKAILRDSYSIIPVPLGAIQKTEIDYRLMEADKRENHMDEITSYLKDDCRFLFDAVKAFRERAGKKITIAANALSFARSLGLDMGRTHKIFDDEFREYYFGGRTQCFRPGAHKNFTVADIVSSYPFAMMQDHATGVDRIVKSGAGALEGFSDEEIQRAFITLNCHSRGAFPRRGKHGSLEFPFERGLFRVTGWEYLTALRHGLITEIEIIDAKFFERTINFAPYVNHWFELKSSTNKKTDPITYTIAKIMQNSLYGKAAQNPMRYYDYEIKPAGSEINSAEGWELWIEYGDIEFHRRSCAWNYRYKWGREMETKPLFYNVATGASITGLARANLLDAACRVGIDNVIYCDTDSLMFTGSGATRLSIGKELGQWEIEGIASEGYFAGKKLYGVRYPGGEEKIASKGCKLTFAEIAKLAKGEKVIWRSEAPSFSLSRGILPGADIDSEAFFLHREIRATGAK